MNEDINALVQEAVQKELEARSFGLQDRLKQVRTPRERLEHKVAARLGYAPGIFPAFFENYNDEELEALTVEQWVKDWAEAGFAIQSRPATPAEKEARRLANEQALAESRRKAQELHLARQEEKIAKLQQKLDRDRQKAMENG